MDLDKIHKLGELAASLEQLRVYLYKIAWETDRAEAAGNLGWFWDLSFYVNAKKLAWRFCDVAPDVYGGIVASLDFPVEGFLRGTFVNRAAGLTLDVQQQKISEEYEDRIF